MRKIASLLLVLFLFVALLTGCGAPATQEESPAATESPASSSESSADVSASSGAAPAVPEAAQGKKIGVLFYSRDDALGSAVYGMLNHAAEALGAEIVWKIGDTDPTAQITAAENMIASGVDGIIMLPVSESVTQKVAALCQENQVYYGICFRTVADSQEIHDEVWANEYFVSSCIEDETASAAQMIELMVEQGRTNLGIGYINPGNTLATRNAGFDEGLASSGATKLAEYTLPDTFDLNSIASTIQNFISSFPEMDGIVWVGSSMGMGETILNTLRSIDPEAKVPLATFDTFEGMEEGFADGHLVGITGGHSVDALFTFMMVYNAVTGTPLAEEPQQLYNNYIFVTSAEDCENYEKYIDNPDNWVYSAEDIRSMAKVYNPDFSLEELQEIMSNYTLEDVVARKGA